MAGTKRNNAGGDRAPRIHYIVNARLPNKKAYGIQIAKMCEAFIEAGVELTLVIPDIRRPEGSMREFYGLRVEVPTVVLPALDWYDRGRFRFFFASFVFIFRSFRYAKDVLRQDPAAIIYTIDMDTFSFAALSSRRCFAEMHEVKRSNWYTRYFFRRVRGIIATNLPIAQALAQTFGLPRRKVLIEPNGVDLAAFEGVPGKEEARKKLSLPPNAKMALYVGRFYEWKGLEILWEAAKLRPEIDWYVAGDSEEEFIRVTGEKDIPPNLHIVGFLEQEATVLWQAAADALLLLGTKNNERSYRFTAPMKVYEYMASGRPIVASKTPALRSIIETDEALFYEPDDAIDLAKETVRAISAGEKIEAMITDARTDAQAHTWRLRAARILDFISRA